MGGWKLYVYMAFFLALGIVFQGLRWLLPLPPPVSMFLIGSLVNMTLLLAVRITQRRRAACIGLLLPLVAFLQGQLSIVPMVFLVGMGNAAYVLWANYCWKHLSVWTAPLLKALLLYSGTKGLFFALGLTGPLAAALLFMMSWPQVFTGAAGLFLARCLLPRLQFFPHTKENK